MKAIDNICSGALPAMAAVGGEADLVPDVRAADAAHSV